jgi:hypothetical protein
MLQIKTNYKHMKLITILSTLLITLTSCNCQKKATDAGLVGEKSENTIVSEKPSAMTENQDLPLIVYESSSRGYFRMITIEGRRIYVQSARAAKPVFWELKPEDYKAIENDYKAINVKELPNLKAPSEKRFYDAAPITSLKVTIGEDIFLTPDFDGGTPPAHIEKLVNTLLRIAEKLN